MISSLTSFNESKSKIFAPLKLFFRLGTYKVPKQKGMPMTFEIYELHFTEKALGNGYSFENIQKCLTYAKPLIENGLPVIYDINHLAGLVGYNHAYIKRATISTKYFYRAFEIKKKNGGTRIISEPLPSLKEIQHWILKEILYKCKVSRYTKAYLPKKSIREHLRFHTREKEVLTVDFDSFFTSIKEKLVLDFFSNLGYSKEVSKILTGLCTLEKCLPQGAPTSPYLSNLLLREFDTKTADFSFANELKFSRYADDLAFSGASIDVPNVLDFVRKEIAPLGLTIKDSKTTLMKSNVKQLISGIVVNAKMQVPKEKRNEIRAAMFYIKKFGLESHMARIQERRQNYLKHLLGKINYILTINPADKEFLDYKQYLETLYRKKSNENHDLH